MRAYITGNFLVGLKAAGLPETVLWAPKRPIWKGYGQTGAHLIADTLWLPTEWEMYNNNEYAEASTETADNQVHLEYYSGYAERCKYDSSGSAPYWTASPASGSATDFVASEVGELLSTAATVTMGGLVPAFCVK
jgi:hypothetical protein